MNSSLSAGLSGLLLTAAIAAIPASSCAQVVAWAYVVPNGQGAVFEPSANYQHTPTGAPVTVERLGPQQNRFRVRFPDTGSADGVVHVSAKNGNHTAVVNSWSSLAGEIRVVVETFDAAGGPANDGRFTVMFRRSGDDDQRQAYLWAHSESDPSYTPSAFYSFNGDRPDPTITRSGNGSYTVVLPGLANTGDELGHVQVTPFAQPGTARRAKVFAWDHIGNDVHVEVRCFDAAGTLTDTQFTLSYNETAAPMSAQDGSGAHVWANEQGSVIYTPDPDYTDSNGTFGPADSESIQRTGVGEYTVNLPNVVAVDSSTVQVTAYGPGSAYATIKSWTSDNCGGTNVNVETFNAAGFPVDSRFTMLYLTDRPIVTPEVAWAYVNPVGEGASFTPSATYQHMTSGGTITVDRDPLQQNRFLITIPNIENDGVAHVTAYQGNHTAVVNGWSQSGDDVRIAVELFDPAGGPADNERFLVHYRRGGNNRNREAYVFAHQPVIPAYTPTSDYTWNANRDDPTITRSGVGIYQVYLPGLIPEGSEYGNVQVTPYANDLLRAKVQGWAPLGDSMRVTVRCTDASGTPTDGRFLLSYNETAAPISIHQGSGAHVWANEPNAASYAPSGEFADSNGTFGPLNSEMIERVNTGRYRVLLPNVVASSSATVQVTAYGTGAEYASIEYFNATGVASGTQVYVETFDASGTPVDASFTLLYLTDRPATGEAPASNTSFGSGCHGLVLEGLSRPVSCQPWDLGLTGVPAGSVVGVLQLDVADASVPLAALGAPGCSVYTTGAFTEVLLMPLPTPVYSFAVPHNPALIGLSLYAQAGVLNATVNALGIATSNGVHGIIGDL